MEKAEVGDHLVVESEEVGERAREGEVLEVLGAGETMHYLVRWEDGHSSIIYPSVGSTAVRHARKGAPA
jgi:Domain of unknown function (DUF1918)